VVNPQLSKAFFAAITAALTSSAPPNEITAQVFSVAGSITSISLDFFGTTHCPLI